MLLLRYSNFMPELSKPSCRHRGRRRGLDQNIFGLAAIGAGIHAQRAADGAGNAELEFEPADVRRRRRFRDALVERGRAGAYDVAIGRDVTPKPRGDRRITTPGKPRSRTIMLEPTPMQ